jgi:transcriptional regulator with XRE-family HTH domain
MSSTVPAEPPCTFGARLYALRMKRGLSQQQLASLLGISDSYVSALENERKRPPPLDVVTRWAHALTLAAPQLNEFVEATKAARTSSARHPISPEVRRVITLLRRAAPKLEPAALQNLECQLKEASSEP